MPRQSKRTSLGYISSLDEKHCVVCSKVKYDAKTRALLPLQTMDLKKYGYDLHEAEKPSIHFSKIHKEKGPKYANAGERILLSLNTILTLFAADVAYHAKCYHTFRSSSWKIESKNQSKNPKDLDEFVSVIEDLVVFRKEVCTMSQLQDLYCKIGDHTNVGAINIKKLLQEQLLDKVQFCKPSGSSDKTSEYILPSDMSVLPDSIDAINTGEGITNHIQLRSISRSISDELNTTFRINLDHLRHKTLLK